MHWEKAFSSPDRSLSSESSFRIMVKSSEEILKRVEEMRLNRQTMIARLEDILQYYIFPGECKYLSGF